MKAPSLDSNSWRVRHRVLRVLDVMSLIVLFGIAAGFGHVVELAVARHVQGELVWSSRDFLWMAPITYTLVLLPGGVVVGLLALASGRSWVLGVAVAAVTASATFGLLLPYSQIARLVSLFLAIVIGVQLARFVLSSPNRTLRHVRRLAAAGSTLVGVLAVLMPALRSWRESHALGELGVAAAGAPNILLIILDTVRAASFGLYAGAPATTPRLAQWANEGTVFDNAYAPAPWTLPSHASFFTGRYAGELDADWKIPLGTRDSTLAEALRARGYATGAFVGNMHYTAWDSGLDRGFATYRDYRRTWNQLLVSSSYTQTRLFRQLRAARSIGVALRALRNPDLSIDIKHTFDHRYGDDISLSFLEWQRGIGARPFFAFLNYFDAHQPYWSPKSFQTYAPSKTGIDKYHAAITWLDSQISDVLDTLRARGVLDKTLVIVTSDHGELFAEHGLSGHAHNLYRNVLHVPLLVRFPERVPRNRRVNALASLRDLPSTIADLAGVTRSPFPGSSLAITWSEGNGHTSPIVAEVSQAPNVDSSYPTGKGPMTALIDSVLHYIRNGDGGEELFDMRADTGETHNLIDAVAYREHAALQRIRLDSIRQAREARAQ